MKVIITAGGTSERIDDVRTITNSSTGRLGYAIGKTFAEKYGEKIAVGADVKELQESLIKLGFDCGSCRPPLDGLPDADVQKLRDCLDELELLAYNN